MEFMELALRMCTKGEFAPYGFVGEWTPEDETIIKTEIDKHVTPTVDAMFNNWRFSHYGGFFAKRAWDMGGINAVTAQELAQKIAEYYAERNPRLLDDEALVVKLNGAVDVINEIVLQYAGGLPSNLAWRMGNQLAECQRGIGKLLGNGVPVPVTSAQVAEVAKVKLPSMFRAKSFSLKSCDDCGNDLPVNSRAAVCQKCRAKRQ